VVKGKGKVVPVPFLTEQQAMNSYHKRGQILMIVNSQKWPNIGGIRLTEVAKYWR
jgi:hypothetical protein